MPPTREAGVSRFATDDGVQLVGELVLPESDAPVPAALILNGSGPLDRDSNVPGQALDVANALASMLASHRVASLRFDKRGVGESGGDYLTTSFDRETDDAAAALDTLRREPRIDPERVTVVGHSVGATIAIRLASRDTTIAGVVLLAGSSTRGEDVMRWQSERIARSMRWVQRPFARGFLREQERVRRSLLASEREVETIDGEEVPASWLREFIAYDPAPDLRAIRCPVLAVTGGKDIQVDADDVARMGELVEGPFEGETPADLTHVLRRHAGRAGLDTYSAQLERPLDAELADRVATWVASR